MPVHRRDHRLANQEPGDAKGRIAILLGAQPADGAQVGTRAEAPARPGEHGHRQRLVGVEPAERRGQSVGGAAVDRVADLGPVDGHDEDVAVAFELH